MDRHPIVIVFVPKSPLPHQMALMLLLLLLREEMLREISMTIKLRSSLLFFLVTLIPTLLSGDQAQNGNGCSAASDTYSLPFVRAAMDFFSPNKGFGWAGEAKKYTNLTPSLSQMGDAVSIAVLKIYDPKELIRPVNAEAYLTVIRNTFVDRTRVLEESNREPRVTSFVLAYLEENEIGDVGLRKRIAYVKSCINDFVCSSQGEAAFFNKQ